MSSSENVATDGKNGQPEAAKQDGQPEAAKQDGPAAAKLDLSGLGSVKLQHQAGPAHDFSKAAALTQTAINNLGGPIHASMIDHKPVDVALAQALTQTAISKQGEKHVDSEKLPKDRAIAEALTLNAIAHQPQDKLKQTGRRSSLEGGLTSEQQAVLLEDAKAEKDRKAAAKVFGGGDSKEAMASILGEINNQGIIAVPSHKVPDDNIALNQLKTLAQISSGDAASKLKHTEAPADTSIAQAQTLKALSSDSAKAQLKHTENDHTKRRGSDAALTQGQTLYAIGHKEQPLKAVEQPKEGLSKDEIAALQAAAQQEKGEAAQGAASQSQPAKAE